MNFVIRVVVNSAALWLTSLLLPGIHMPDHTDLLRQVLIVLLIGAIFTLVNLVVKPITMIFSIPFLVLTLGLFYFVVNALMLMLTGWVTEQIGYGLEVDSFWWALAGGIIVAIIAGILNVLLPSEDKRRRR